MKILDSGIDLVFKIAAIGIIVSVLHNLLNQAGKSELGIMTSLAGLMVALILIVQKVGQLFDAVKPLFEL